MAVYLGSNRVGVKGGTPVVVEGADLTLATANAEDIVVNTKAYTKTGLTDGTNPYKKTETDNTVSTQANLMSQILTALDGKASGGNSGITPSGTMSITSNGPYDVTNYASANVNVANSGGIDTTIANDKAATASDIAYGKQVYVNGQLITGDVSVRSTNLASHSGTIATSGTANNITGIGISYTYTQDTLIRKGVTITRYVDPSSFGDATTDDVSSEKYFTSSVGVKKKGTGTIGGSSGGATSGSVVKAWTTSDATVASGYSNVSVNYGTEVVNTDGVLSLGGTTKTITVSSAADLDVIKGNYVKITSSYTSSSTPSGIYYVPTDATFTQSGTTTKTYKVDKCNQMFVLA